MGSFNPDSAKQQRALSLAGLIADPSLHRRFRQGGETILFRANDFADPDRSEVFGLLRRHGTLRPAAENFAAVCRGDIAAVPSLDDFIAGRNIPSAPAAAPTARVAATPRAARYIGPCPVLPADDFAAVGNCVGRRIELVGQITAVRRGIGERGNRRGKPCVVVDFGPPRGDGVRVWIWAESAAQLRDAPDESWVGRWAGIIGLVEPPHTERHFWRQQTNLGISTENPHEIDVISEDEARFRLNGGDAPTPALAAPPRRAAMPAGANRRLVARLLGGDAAPAPAKAWRPGRSNRAILQALHPRAAPATRNPPATAGAQRAAPIPRRPAPRPAIPKSGSIVIHPQNRVMPPPPQPAAAPAEPTAWQRVVRLFGIG